MEERRSCNETLPFIFEHLRCCDICNRNKSVKMSTLIILKAIQLFKQIVKSSQSR